MNRIVLASFLLVVLASTGISQGISLADAARLERDRHKEIEIRKAQLVKEVLRYSSAQPALEELSQTFSDSTDKLFTQLSPDRRNRLKKAAAETFVPSKLMLAFERTFAIKMDVVSLEEVSHFYKTSTGAKVLRAESNKTAKPDEEFLKRVSRPRALLIEDFERQTQGAERTAACFAALNKAILGQMLTLSTAPERYKEAFLLGYEESFSQNAANRLRSPILASNLYTYRSLSDDELREYLAFIKSPAGRRFVGATWDAMEKSLSQGGADVGAALSETLKQMKDETPQ
jgi:hypothetical protein